MLYQILYFRGIQQVGMPINLNLSESTNNKVTVKFKGTLRNTKRPNQRTRKSETKITSRSQHTVSNSRKSRVRGGRASNPHEVRFPTDWSAGSCWGVRVRCDKLAPEGLISSCWPRTLRKSCRILELRRSALFYRLYQRVSDWYLIGGGGVRTAKGHFTNSCW